MVTNRHPSVTRGIHADEEPGIKLVFIRDTGKRESYESIPLTTVEATQLAYELLKHALLEQGARLR